ncbi:MAG: OmpH family outer membrane protein [Planctomycetota bacterium]|nr:MAG: OmpH family outer membrane protein [Planctomycetota bacterium]
MRPNRINTLLPVMLILAAALAWHAGASTATMRPPAQPTTVATLDIVTVFEQLNERSTLEAQLKTRVEKRQSQLDEINKAIQAIQADLETTLKPGTDEYKERVRQFMEQRAVAEARRTALQQIISIDQGAMRRQLYTKIQDAVKRIAERDGIDIVIFDDSVLPVPEDASDNDVYRTIITKGIIYRHNSIDLTQRVITLMNNEYAAP